MRSKPIATRPDLLALLAAAKNHVMSPEERAAQRKSWVIGNFMLDHPEATREHAEKIYAEVIGG